MWKTFANLLSKKTISIFVLVFLYYFSLLFVINEKTFLITTILFGSVAFFTLRVAIPELISLLLLSVLFLEKGIRDWYMPVVPAGIQPWETGYSFYFGLSLKLVFASTFLILGLFSLRSFKLRGAKSQKLNDILLLSFYSFVAISVLFVNFSTFSLLGLIRLIVPICAYLSSRIFAKHNHLVYIALPLLLFLGFIGTLQYMQQGSLGLFLEDTAYTKMAGFYTTDGQLQYRVSGLFGHPTFFASFMSLLIPIALGFMVQYYIDRKRYNVMFYLAGLGTTLGLLSIVGTLSRSGVLSIVFIGCAFFWKLFLSRHRVFIVRARKLLIYSTVVASLIIVFVWFPLLTRLQSFKEVATIGNGKGRINLALQAIPMIQNSPFFGVGLNQFTQAMVQRDLPPDVRHFLYPVHNTFLLFFAETGIASGIVFIAFIIYTLWKSWNKTNNWVTFGVWVGVCTFILNSQFHTLFNQDPTFDLVMVMLGYLASK